MSLRPAPARWFEVLTTREDLAATLETLAATDRIELETHSETYPSVNLENLQSRLHEVDRLARRYQPYWPTTGLRPTPEGGKPGTLLENALQRLRDWETQALPLIKRIERVNSEEVNLSLLQAFLNQVADARLEYNLLTTRGDTLSAHLFALPTDSLAAVNAGDLLVSHYHGVFHHFVLAVGELDALERLGNELTANKGQRVAIPEALREHGDSARLWIDARIRHNEHQLQSLRAALAELSAPHHLHEALGDIKRLEWFLTHVTSLPVSKNFAWITGWSSDLDGRHLQAALAGAGVNAVMHFPPPPQNLEAPRVMHNPWWAKPFEIFPRLLGTPSGTEADPSRLLAVLVPLMFGYMFGDVGQGLVLVIAGLALKGRWPMLRILVANGLAAMAFGLVFGSVFGREDILPALWLHPVADPLPVLMVPLAGGVLIILTGLVLNAAEAAWRGAARRWLLSDAAVMVLYLSLLASFFFSAAKFIAVVALAWYLAGAWWLARPRAFSALAAAIGQLLEHSIQLMINTLSFVRIGAFALAHGGLSMAFNIMSDAVGSLPAAALILVLGNIIVIALEGLVVTIQTTRLILFEFFIRFLQAGGRTFRPLTAPARDAVMRRVT